MAHPGKGKLQAYMTDVTSLNNLYKKLAHKIEPTL